MAPEFLEGGQVVAGGKLRILRLIGEGGMGAVYEVEHLLTGHRRALKILRAELGDHTEAVERFRMEATVAARIRTRAVVQTFDAGVLEDGSPYLLMELLHGTPLDVLVAEGPLDVHLAVDVITQCCEALHEAHQAGVVHRDIKPENVFVVGDEANPKIKLLDFGISKFIDHDTGSNTIDGTALGTAHYMSPEQSCGLNSIVDHRTDIYSLGVVLFECLTGRKPFDGPTFPSIILAIDRGVRPTIGELRPGVPDAFESVVSAALCKQPEERFGTMLDFSEALQAVELDPHLSRSSIRAVELSAATSASPGVNTEQRTRASRPSGIPREDLAALPTTSRRPLVLAVGIALVLVALIVAALTSGEGTAPEPTRLPTTTAAPSAPVDEPGPERATVADALPLGVVVPSALPETAIERTPGTTSTNRVIPTDNPDRSADTRRPADAPPAELGEVPDPTHETTSPHAPPIAAAGTQATPLPPTTAAAEPTTPASPSAQPTGELGGLDRSNPYGN